MLSSLPEQVIKAIDSADIVVFEGFEMTGKSYLAKQVSKEYSSLLYRPDWENVMTDKVVSRGNRYIPGLAIVGLWKQLKDTKCHPPKFIIDRWMAVSYVYQIQYNQSADCVSLDEMVNAHKNATDGMKLVIIHKSHEDIDEAKKMYEISKLSDDHADIYDKFDSFEDYYEAYQRFNNEYLKFYAEKCPFDTYDLSSLGNHVLNQWKGLD